MFDQVMTVFNAFNELNKANPMLATILGAGGVTAIIMSLRQIPSRIFNFIFGQMTTSLVMNNAGWDGGSDQFRSFMLWYVKHSWSRWSRTLSLETQWQNRGDPLVAIGAGFGRHFFCYKRRLFWFDKIKLDSAGTNIEKHEIIITGLTRSRSIYDAMIQEFRYRVNSNTITVSSWEYDKWSEPAPITKRALETVVMERGLKDALIQDIDRFYASREWYEDRGLPYKRCILFYGQPGTGKTSIIKALASHYGRNVYMLNLSTLSDSTLHRAMNSIPEGSILLFEDFDTNSTVAKRHIAPAPALEPIESRVPAVTVGVSAPAIAEPLPPQHESFMALSLSGLLNALDGIVPMDGTLIFMTTNHIEKIDAALLRNGRVDRRDYIGHLGDPEVRDYIELMFPGTVIPEGLFFREIAGCDLMSIFSDNRDDVTVFIDAIPKVYLGTGVTQALDITEQNSLLLEATDV